MSDVDLPEGWVPANLGNIVRVSSGVGFPKKHQGKLEGLYPVYKVGDVSKAVINANGNLNTAGHFVDEHVATELKGEIFPKGTTLFAKIGEAVKLNRRAFVLRPGLADNNVMAVLPESRDGDRFFYHFMRTVDLTDISRSTTVPSVRKGDIEDIELTLPPLAEQKVIADKLDTLLAQVEATKARLERIPDILKRFRQSVLAAAVSGRLTEGWRGSYEYVHVHEKNIPAEWKIAPFKGVCEKVQSGSTPRDNPFDQNGSVPFLKVYNIVNQKIDFDYKPQFVTDEIHRGSLKRSIAYPNDVLMNIVGPPLGKVAVLTAQYPEWNLNQAITLFRADPKSLHYLYLYFVLCEGDLVRKVMPDTKGSVGQINISLSQCRDALIAIPSLEEQTEIVRRVEQLFAFADSIEQKASAALARVNHLTQSILAKAFRGELTSEWRAAHPDLITGENSAEALLARIKAERAANPSAKKSRAQADASNILDLAVFFP